MTAAAGIMSEQAANVADALANCPSFIAEVGATDPAGAIEYSPTIIETGPNIKRPGVLVCDVRSLKGDKWGYVAGQIAVIFGRDVEEEFRRQTPDADGNTHPDGPNPREAMIRFNNWVGAVVSEVMIEFMKPGRLMVTGFERNVWPMRSEVDERDADGNVADYLTQTVVFNFGTV